MRWTRLANKILRNQFDRIRDKRLRVEGRWAMLARNIRKIPLNRRIYLSLAWARFSREMLIRQYKVSAL